MRRCNGGTEALAHAYAKPQRWLCSVFYLRAAINNPDLVSLFGESCFSYRGSTGAPRLPSVTQG